jgi:MFS family permease
MAKLGGIGEAFSDRNFRIYSVGSVISWITYFIQTIAFSWAAWEASRSTTWLAVISLLTVLATVLFIPLGGVFADRHDRFRMAMAAYACDAVKTLVLTGLALSGNLTLPVLCVSAFLHGLIHSFSIPASFGMMPRFVARDKLAAAIGVNAAYTQFAIFLGPAIAGWILIHWGLAAAFATNAVGYAIYFATMSLLRTPPGYSQSRGAPKSIRHDLFEGARYIIGHRGLSALLLLVLAGDAVSMAVYQMMPAYSDLVLSMGAGGVSMLYSAAGVGATLAALWLAHGGTRRATPANVLWAVSGIALSIGLMASVPSLAVAVIAMLLFGFSGETRRTATASLMQTSIDDIKRGRVMSTLFLFTQVAGGLGTVLVGLAAQGAGLRVPMAVAAVLLGIVWLIAIRKRQQIALSFPASASG